MDWDERKNQANMLKHGISFEEAQEVFSDPNAIEFYDKEHSTDGEDRYIIIGATSRCVVLNVVYTDKLGNTRIITARHATSQEKEVYYERLRSIYR